MTAEMLTPDEAAVERVRRQADMSRGVGMRVSVTGADLAVVLRLLDESRAALAALDKPVQVKPERRRRFPSNGAGVLAAVVAAADDVMRSYPELWGQSLLDALPRWVEKTGTQLPDGWVDSVDAVL